MSISKYFLVALLVVGALTAGPDTAAAQANIPSGGVELGGYGWSGYNDGSGLVGAGWISMSCKNNNSCASDGGNDYGVTLNTDGTLTGYAWSPNIGWIKFGGLSGFPVTARVLNDNAQMVGDYNTSLTARGWARACAGAANAGSCSGGMNPASGGWDGWISLGDLMGTYNITTDSTGFAAGSYAWGSPTVVGWIDFSPVSYGATPPPVTTPTISSFTADPIEVTVDDLSDLTYNVTDVTGCTASNDNGDTVWDSVLNSGLSLPVAAGDQTVTVTPPLGTTEYTLECTDGSTTVTEDVTVVARPDIVIGAISTTEGVFDGVSGEFDTVDFDAQVSGIPNGQSVNYIVTFGSFTDTGNITGTGVNNSVPLSVTFDDVPYTTGPSVTFRVDTSPAPDGAVDEDIAATPADEDDNTRTGTASLTFPPPNLTFTGPPVVRSGDPAEITWEIVSTPYNMNCSIDGPFSSAVTFSYIANDPLISGSAFSDDLFNTTTFDLTCDTGYTDSHQVEVIPTFEEV